MADYTISVTLSGDDSSFQQMFNNAQKSVDSFKARTSGVTSGLSSFGAKCTEIGSKLTKSITTPALGAATALGGLTIGKGFKRLTGIDDARAKLKGLGHSADDVKSIMNNALESVKGTSYGLDAAATTAAGAVAAGVKPGKDLTRYLSLTADAAAEAGINMSDMGSIINKVQTSGVAMSDNLNQLADRGLPIFQWIADEAGVSADAVKDMAAKGQISSEMFLNAIEKNIGGAAKTIGEESFTAALANMGASLSRIGANFLNAGNSGKGAFDQLKPLIGEVTEILGGVEDKAVEWGETLGNAMSVVVDKFHELKDNFDNLSDKQQGVVKNAAGMGAMFTVGLGPAINIIGKTSTALGKFSGGVDSLFGKIQPLTSSFSPLLQKVIGFAPAFSKGFAIAAVVGVALAGLGLLQDNFGTKINDMITVVSEKGPEIINRLSSTIVGNLPRLIALGAQLISSLVSAITANLPALLSAGIRILSSLLLGVSMQLPELAVAALDLIMTLVTGLIDNLPIILNTGIQILVNLIDGIIAQLPKLIVMGVNLIMTLVTGLISAIPQILSAMPRIISAIWNALKDVNWKDLGKQVVDGLINGLKSMLSSLKDAAQEVANSIKNKFKDIMGIHSPSKVFFEYGYFLDKGLANGVVQNADLVEQAYATVGFDTPDMSSSAGDYGYTEPLNSTPYDGFMDMFKAYSERQAKAIENGLKGAKLIGNNRELGRFVADLGFARS